MPSDKKSTKPWKCSKNCKNSHKKMCKHLEARMPKANSSVYMVMLQDIDKYPDVRDIEEAYDKEMEFRDKLEAMGLEEIRVEVLVLRALYKMSFANIAEELCIPDRQTAFYIFRKSCEILAERGLIK